MRCSMSIRLDQQPWKLYFNGSGFPSWDIRNSFYCIDFGFLSHGVRTFADVFKKLENLLEHLGIRLRPKFQVVKRVGSQNQIFHCSAPTESTVRCRLAEWILLTTWRWHCFAGGKGFQWANCNHRAVEPRSHLICFREKSVHDFFETDPKKLRILLEFF